MRFGQKKIVLNREEMSVLFELMHDHCAKTIPMLEAKKGIVESPYEKEKCQKEIDMLYLLKSKVCPG